MQLFALLAFVGLVSGEVVNLHSCGDVADCEIHEIRIDPCTQAPGTCVIKKGKEASISFDYTPNFSATKLKGMVYWANRVVDLPFMGMDSDACKFTPCPAVQGTKQTYSYNLAISKKFPSSTFPIKWILWNVANTSQTCCFLTDIKLKP